MNQNNNAAEIILKDGAQQHFQKMLARMPGTVGVRFDVTKTGCSGYSYACEMVTENQILPTDLKIMGPYDFSVWMTARAKDFINGLIVDYQTIGFGQSKLIYTNPNETARCGCGVSFSIDKTSGTAS